MKKIVTSTHFYRLVTLLSVLLTSQSYSQDNQITRTKMPSVEAVKKKIKSDNIYNTYVKQAGAFDQLRLVLKSIDGNRTNPLTSEERQIDDQYLTAYRQLVHKAQLPARGSAKYLRNERVKLLTYYSISRTFRSNLYEMFFDKNVINTVEPLVQEQLFYGNRTVEEVQRQIEDDKEKDIDRRRPFQHEIKWAAPICLISLVWFLWAVSNERKKRNPKKDLFTLYAGQREFTIYSFTGEVVSKETMIESGSTIQGNSQTGYRTTSYRYQHDKFFVKAFDGQEHSVHLVDSGIMVRPGTTLTALWAIRKGKETGPYFFFYNHDTKQETILRKNVNKIFHFSFRTVISLAIFLYTFPIVLFHYGANLINESFGKFGSVASTFLSIFFPLKFNISLSFNLIFIFLIIRFFISFTRRRNFLKVQLPKILLSLKGRM